MDPPARRQAAAVEDRALAHQGEAEGDRRAARRRDERPHLLQGPLVRVRRRALRGRAAAGDRLARARSPRRCWSRCPIRSRRRSSTWRSRAKARTIASSPSCRRARASRAPPRSSPSTACASNIPTASASCGPRTRRRCIVLRFEGDTAGGARAHPADFRRVLSAALLRVGQKNRVRTDSQRFLPMDLRGLSPLWSERELHGDVGPVLLRPCRRCCPGARRRL